MMFGSSLLVRFSRGFVHYRRAHVGSWLAAIIVTLTALSGLADPSLAANPECENLAARGIEKQENLRASEILVRCGVAKGGSPSTLVSPSHPFSLSPGAAPASPLEPSFSGSDVDVITGAETFPHVTQSESSVWGHGSTVVVNYNDSKGVEENPLNISGISVSKDGGASFTRLATPSGTSPLSGHGENFGDPILVYDEKLGKWFAGDLVRAACGGGGIGLWESADGEQWSPGACAHYGGEDDRDSMWVDNNSQSPFYGRMYVSYNNFAQGGRLEVVHSDNGVEWSAPVALTSVFQRDVQLTGSPDTGTPGDVFVVGQNENGGGVGNKGQENFMYRSTNGGETWTSTSMGEKFEVAGNTSCGYFPAIPPIWRETGWGQPAVGPNGVVMYDYAAHGEGSDESDIYFVRSTNNGETWSAPIRLNTDSSGKAQWMPSLRVTPSGVVEATWYDRRNTTNGENYQRFARVSYDNGATWGPDQPLSTAVIPQPTQPDERIVKCYAGDYNYTTANENTGLDTWTDGRVSIEKPGTTEKVPTQKVFFHSIPLEAAAPVTNVQPNTGPPSGGTRVIITGSEVGKAREVEFGATSAHFTRNSPTSITAVSPPGMSGTTDVTVVTPKGISTTGPADQFSYRPGVGLAWGFNEKGQLGNGTTTDSSTPVEVKGMTEATSVSGGGLFSLAALKSGKVMSWGFNLFGELGDGTYGNKNVPVEVCAVGETKRPCGNHLSEVGTVSAGETFGLALKNQHIAAWGFNNQGQLGNATTTPSNVPVEVCEVGETKSPCKSHLGEVTAIAAGGYFGLALLNNGHVMAWGENRSGELGDGKTESEQPSSDVPVEVKGISEAIAIAAGRTFALALLKNGEVVAWGQNNSGQLGDGKSGSEQAYSDVPVAVCVGAPCEKHLGGVTALAAGGEGSSFALGSDGTVMAWGANEFGQLGTGNMTSPTSPVKVPGLTEVTAIAAGSHHSLDLLRSGKVEAAGENAFGQVGNGTKQNSDKPVPVTEVVGAAAIAGGDLHSLAIGSLPATLTNVQPNAAPPVAGTKVTISGTHLAIASEVSFGTIKAQSFTVNSPTSITVVTPAGAAGRSVDVSATTPAGTTSTSPADKFAWRSGSGLAWGANEHGQLGNGGTTGSDLPVPELGGVVAVAGADGGHSLALLPNGAVRAVGINQYGQLGDGTVTGPETCQAEAHSAPCSRTPVNVTGLGEGVKAIAAGALHSLALMKSGAVRAWGINEEGRLGDNRTAVEQRSSDVPVEVCAVGESEITHTCTEHLSKVKAIAGGLNFSLAVLTSGKVVAWGSNESGQLGDGKTKTEQRFSLVPVYVKGLSGETVLGEKEKVTAIATGYTYALALLESGQVVAWGANEYGQLGDGPNTGPEICERNGEKLGCSRTPVKLTEPNEVSAIAAGAQFSLALLKKSGQVMAWGRNDHGQLGDGKTATEQEISEKPVNVVCTVGEKAPCTQGHLSEVIAIAGGGRHSSALLSNGTVRAWGHNNAGQLGDGKSPTEQPTSDVPVEVTGLSEASAIAGGGEFNLALRNGNVLAWGANEYGQLGIGTNTGPEICIPPLPCSTVPVTMNGLTPLALAAGEDHSLALLSEGTVLSWGDNKSSQLGDGKSGSEQEISDVPVFVCKIAEFPCQIEHVLSEVSAVAAGSKFSLALLTNGRVMAWGSNESGQLGDGKTATEQPSSDFAVEVTGLSEKVTAIAAGGAHALAVLNSGKVVAWGSNKSGQLGDSKSPTEQPTSDVPVEVKGLSEAIGVSGGGEFSLALLKSGVAKAWGSNGAGQLGDGKSPSEQPSSDVSVEVQGLSEATSLAAGESFGYALRGDGTVMAWGENKYGQFGNGTMKGSNKPEEGTLSEVSAIAAGYRFSLYQLRNGTVEGSGEDTKGQLGNGTAGEAFPTPVQAKELTEVTDIAGGGYHSLAIGRL